VKGSVVHALRGKRRVVVYGPSGSGKSTLARRIGAALSVPVVELDALYHGPSWASAPTESFRAAVGSALDAHAHGWICDGNYSIVRDVVLARADAIVWLKLPFHLVTAQLLWRTVRRAWTREALWNGNHETWRQSFASRQSILLWGVTHWRAHFRVTAAGIAAHGAHLPRIELASTRDVRALVQGLSSASAARDGG